MPGFLMVGGVEGRGGLTARTSTFSISSAIMSAAEMCERSMIAVSHWLEQLEHFANLDLGRAARAGIPEVVLAERKTPEQTVAIARRLLDELGRVLVSRVPPETLAALAAGFGEEVVWERYAGGHTLALH